MRSDDLRLTPVETVMRKKRRIRNVLVLVVLLVVGYYLVFKMTYSPYYASMDEHFKYGSIGSETANGLPYWVWKALPAMYPERLNGQGYEAFGLLYEEGRDLPIGVSKRKVQGIDRVWLNCSVCHTGTYRETADAERQLILGAPSNNLRLYDFIQFLRFASLDNRFTGEVPFPDHASADVVLEKIDAVGGDLNALERLIYRYVVINRVRDGLVELREQLAFLDRQHDWGPGRVDTFNPYKVIQFNYPMDDLTDEQLNGSADYPSIWQQGPRQGMQLHWDGNNPSVQERNLSAALGAGVTPVTVDMNSIKRLEEWLWDFSAPVYPKLDRLDPEKLATGQALYARYCAACHGAKTNGVYDYDTQKYSRLGTVESIARIRTDRGRWASYTREFADNQNLLYAGYPWRFKNFRKTQGYANQPLDGIWARSPYLHNGSVPTLRDLLEPAEDRPVLFYRGYDVFDFDKVGYVADVAREGDREFFRYDTRVTGNSNSGHEGKAYGTHLSSEQKDAIVEYMKTL